MTETVTAVIPTVGRPSLYRAVETVLSQTHPVREVIVVADTDRPVTLPPDNRVALIRNETCVGPARSRQTGIDAATGTVIALLDDDDEWLDTKIEHQLNKASDFTDRRWVISCRAMVVGPDHQQRIWPRHLIAPGQPVADYLFRFTELRTGAAELQSSTLCFPIELAHAVRWDAHAGAAHDEASWLLAAQRRYPRLEIVHVADVLSKYVVQQLSVSRDIADHTDAYIAWGLEYLAEESPRVLGDYLATSPVSAAVSANSLRGVTQSLCAAIRYGRPGPYALGYAVVNAGRVVANSVRNRTPPKAGKT